MIGEVILKNKLFSGESINIEYKVEMPKKSEKYMKTVVAFANGRGGRIVFGVDDKLQTFLYLTANGMIQGMRPIMSYNYGAKESARVRKIYLMTFEIVVGIMAVGTVICFVMPQTLMSMFTSNPETLTEGAIALHIICAGFIASSVSVVSAGAFEALGKGIQSFLISFLRYVVVIIPAAFVLSKTVGVHGVWHAFWIAEIITAVIAFILYYQLIGKSGKN